MPTAPAPLPDFFEESEEKRQNKIKAWFRCLKCVPFTAPNRQWIERNSVVGHVKSRAHINHVHILEKKEASAAEFCQRVADEERALWEQGEFREVPQFRLPDLQVPVTRKTKSAEEEQMWEDYEMNGADFDLGEDEDAEANRERLRFERAVDNLAYWDVHEVPQGEIEADGDDEMTQWRKMAEEDDVLAEMMERCRGDSDDETADGVDYDTNELNQSLDGAWYPYDSKMMFLLDTLDNLPCMSVSDSLMRVFLWILRESGAKDVPSFDQLRKVQGSLRGQSAIPTKRYKSPQGNIFYYNDPRALIAKDWATPEIRRHIHIYPVLTEGPISEFWHARKWCCEMDLKMLSPMYAASQSRHFYVNELAQLKSGQFIIPKRWLERESDRATLADAFSMKLNDDASGTITIIDAETILIGASNLRWNYLDLQDQENVPRLDDGKEHSICAGHLRDMPNSDRALAMGDSLYTSLLNYWTDDVSGNRTKQFNKHINGYMTHCNLPRRLLQQEFHVHFISTSQHAGAAKQFKPFREAVESTHINPVQVRDAMTGETTRFKLHVNLGTGDNPVQSKISGHISSKGNHYCRKCEAGGCDKHKESQEGYHSLFEPGNLRSATNTVAEINKQLKMACQGVATHIQDLQKETGAELMEWVESHRDEITDPFLTVKGFDPTQDTPVEILHTILLGIIKYIWHMTHTSWKDNQKKTFSLRLQSMNADNLSVHAIQSDYIMQYANSLIGRQLKTLAQTAAFHIYDLTDTFHFMLWKACGELTALLWFPEIDDMNQYLADLDVAVANVLDLFATIDPSKIVQKIKLHLLTHLRDDIIRYGPILGAITEVFEGYNAVFRFCSIFSNHLAPSRDIAISLADQEGLKLRLLGGFWHCDKSDQWVQAGPRVRDALRIYPVLQRHLGWTDHQPLKPGWSFNSPTGNVRLAAMNRKTRQRPTVRWEATTASRALNAEDFKPYQPVLCICTSMIAKSQDKCVAGSWVFVVSPITILSDSAGNSALTVLDQFTIGENRHEEFGMPVLTRHMEETTYVIVHAKHNCRRAKCSATGRRARKQERLDSGVEEHFIEHTSDPFFIINTHSLHNPHLLRRVLPRHLTAPILLFGDRKVMHEELSKKLQSSQDTKRAERKKAQAEKKQQMEGNVNGGAGPSKKQKMVPK
ncbi:hypothetical protein JAAARDRAFT_49804 [Jaapia argillacea MUCL 33604]|uniref:Uncharacterized protein n=1 Tax=Jaapia argillacea MUCL 33604 TaxID=933084 RepID=A0A067PSK6_9AGAM|nr:hypothetical protein JAAARDRAFT_49804 [Jaapia argillacea MUCL 33604]